MPITQLTENVRISDADSVAIKEVDDAGPTAPWCSTSPRPRRWSSCRPRRSWAWRTGSSCGAAQRRATPTSWPSRWAPDWNHKLFVNAELTPTDSANSPGLRLYEAIYQQYGKAISGGIGSFSQMGFTEAEIAVHALETIKGSYTVKSVNAAFKAVSNFDAGMLCQLWTYGSYPMHIPNNEDYTGHPGQRQDGHRPGLHPDLLGQPADRQLPP